MSQIDNTAKADTTTFTVMGLAIGVPEAIHLQERQGQAQVLASTQLPAPCRPEHRAALEAAGVVFGDPTPGDPLFVSATLPTGWRKVGTDHAMHTSVVDARGRKRASIFYKAAFYDRRADLTASPRFAATTKEAEGGTVPIVTDGGAEVWRGPLCSKVPGSPWADHEAAHAMAEAWLNERYPDWRLLTAYWDSP